MKEPEPPAFVRLACPVWDGFHFAAGMLIFLATVATLAAIPAIIFRLVFWR